MLEEKSDNEGYKQCEKKNVGMIQQCQNQNLTKDDANKVQKNVSMTQQYQNKNLTKDDTNKVLFLHVYTYVKTMFSPMFTPTIHMFIPTLTQRLI